MKHDGAAGIFREGINQYMFRLINSYLLLIACQWWKILMAIYCSQCGSKVKGNYHTNLTVDFDLLIMSVTVCDKSLLRRLSHLCVGGGEERNPNFYPYTSTFLLSVFHKRSQQIISAYKPLQVVSIRSAWTSFNMKLWAILCQY